MHTCNGTPSSLSSEEVNITEISLYPKDSFPHNSFTIRVARANLQNIFQVSSLLYFMLGLPWCLTSKNPPSIQETLVQSLGWEDSLEKEMATHSSMAAWRIP